MSIGANIVVGFIALLHIYILVLEMFLWDKPAGLQAFCKTKEEAMVSALARTERISKYHAGLVKIREQDGYSVYFSC